MHAVVDIAGVGAVEGWALTRMAGSRVDRLTGRWSGNRMFFESMIVSNRSCVTMSGDIHGH